MWTCAALLALWIIPIVAYRYARHRLPDHIWCVTGVALGVIVSPASFGMYGLYGLAGFPMVALPCAFLGILGLMLSLFHGPPGFHLATMMGLRESATVVHGIEYVYTESLNAIIWSAIYGTAGWAIDSLIKRRRTN